METIIFKNKIYPKFQSEGNAAQFSIPYAKHFCKGTGVDIGCNRLEWMFPGALPVDPSINEYDAMGNEIGRMIDIDPLSHHLNSVQNNIVGPNHVKLAFQPEAYQTFKKELNAIWERYGMKLNSKLKDLYLSIAPELETVTSIKSREEILRTKVYPEIELPFLRLGNTVITGIETTRSDHSDVIKILKKINSASDVNAQKIQRQFERLRTIDPKFTKFHPIEGIVFDYNGSLYKWTGVFAPINQILGFEKYKNRI
jgi:hypothetical protein